VDEVAHADGDAHEDLRCDKALQGEPSARTEIQHAALLVHRQGGIYTNPFLAWGRYRKHWFKVTLPISFQFHHAQMDGSHAARFLEELQKTINTI